MATDWKHRIVVFIKVRNLTETERDTIYEATGLVFIEGSTTVDYANELAALIGDGGDAEKETFVSMRLSETGNEPATHIGCNTKARDPAKEAIFTTFSSGTFSDSLVLCSDDPIKSPKEGSETGYPQSEVMSGLLMSSGLTQITPTQDP